jgi:hypothetical protein
LCNYGFVVHLHPLQALSYRQLAFVGDAALWMLFAEHAFHTFGQQEDPIRQVWGSGLGLGTT